MSTTTEQLIQTLRALAPTSVKIIPAVVQKVDKTTMTCQVKDLNDNPYVGVRLRAARLDEDEETGLVPVPAKGSAVLISSIDNSRNYFVSATAQLDEVLVRIGKTQVSVTKDRIAFIKDTSKQELSENVTQSTEGSHQITAQKGLTLVVQSPHQVDINNGSLKLGKLLMDLASQIALITVPTGVGPPGLPANATQFTALATKFLTATQNLKNDASCHQHAENESQSQAQKGVGRGGKPIAKQPSKWRTHWPLPSPKRWRPFVKTLTIIATITVPAGIPVATAGSPAAQTGATTAPAQATATFTLS